VLRLLAISVWANILGQTYLILLLYPNNAFLFYFGGSYKNCLTVRCSHVITDAGFVACNTHFVMTIELSPLQNMCAHNHPVAYCPSCSFLLMAFRAHCV
jgi:hypothetical protein